MGVRVARSGEKRTVPLGTRSQPILSAVAKTDTAKHHMKSMAMRPEPRNESFHLCTEDDRLS